MTTDAAATATATAESTAVAADAGHDPEAMRKVMNRLKRAEGQLRALIESMGADSNCKDVVTQLSAVSKALDRAGFMIIANALQSCSTEDADGQGNHDGMTKDDIEKLFLTLA
ncbi:metal-sensitive transcriptional regulator [Salinibacterium sp. SWN1162]|uniref:metal-sensitive transcriptional regulator n=1 Tax=Salinibacterium sp. SWN1162 TaxID=2792053 RepID=UPI0018CF812D|nr:metal-sensing transcriptional repressor [Salinibacterium sp. SWN1162]MBH0008356.1 metal-sensing transcriptional repressor [Salinibacterium sp. SWN1162]